MTVSTARFDPGCWRDPALARRLLQRIADVCAQAGWGEAGRPPLVVMEICGTHTMAIARWGLRSLLPSGLRLISGPGCPVCVTDDGQMDEMMALARRPGVIVATYGDLLKVPDSRGQTLAQARAAGADVRVVYSPLEAVELARQLPERQVVLLGVGFETTAPGAALAVVQAKAMGVNNFFLYSAHRLTPPAMRALLSTGEQRIDAFLIPGHVSAVLGERAFAFLAEEFGCGAVVAGFEPVDILAALLQIVEEAAAHPVAELLAVGEARRDRPAVCGNAQRVVHNEYRRAVRPEGNPRAQELMERVFRVVDADWRGLGRIPASGLALRPEWRAWDAQIRWDLRLDIPPLPSSSPPPTTLPPSATCLDKRATSGCRCGHVLRGVITPPECPLFGRVCTPLQPRGPCMVSSEGACAAYYRYEWRQDLAGG
ncbi:MAG: hydrogenase formation protein HypD [Limnochordaceae bacterium]|nr:hydrogenase formation protein HypD [Limnochordaceae bacterium]